MQRLSQDKAAYGPHQTVEDCLEVANLSGIICHNAGGEVQPHFHVTLCDLQGSAFGGHACYGCQVLITTDVLIDELESITMGSRFDEAVGIPLFEPRMAEYPGL